MAAASAGATGAGEDLTTARPRGRTDIQYYAIGATAVTIGFALLAITWRRSPRVIPATRRAFLATVAPGIASGLHGAVFATAGIVFSLALLSLGRDLHRTGTMAGRSSSRR